MKTKNGEQYKVPGQPDRGKPEPHLPSEKEKNSIRNGAKNEDQLKQLNPNNAQNKDAGEIDSPPVNNKS